MITVTKVFGKLSLLFVIVVLTVVITIVTELLIDNLTLQAREFRHLMKHSMGNIGVLFILVSIAGYSLKKRFGIGRFRINEWLDIHQWLAVTGVVLAGIHSGAHFNALLPRLTSIATIVCLVSGFVGRHIYINTKKEIATRRVTMVEDGLSEAVIAEKLTYAAVTADALSNWRYIHRIFSVTFATLVVAHAVTALLFGG